MSSKVGIKLSADIDSRRFARSVLHHEEQLGHDLYHVPGLEHEVALPLDCLRAQAPGDVRLRLQLPGRRRLK